MGAQPIDVVLTTRPLRQLRVPVAALLLSAFYVERAAAWVSTSPEGDITIRGDAEVRQPHTALSSCPAMSRRSVVAAQPSDHTPIDSAFRLTISSVVDCLHMRP